MVLAPINKFICEMRAMIIHKEELELGSHHAIKRIEVSEWYILDNKQ